MRRSVQRTRAQRDEPSEIAQEPQGFVEHHVIRQREREHAEVFR